MADESDDAGGEMTSSDVRTVLGTARRDQRWSLTELVEVQTILGRTRFDLRNARPLSPDDDVEMSISCVLGTVELLVPYGTRVQLDGTTYLGGSSSDVTESDPDADSGSWAPPASIPPLDITATVILGRVRVHTPDRPASNTWLCRLMEHRRSRKLSKKTEAKLVAKPAPALAAGSDPVEPAVDVGAPPPRVAAAVDVAPTPSPAPTDESVPAAAGAAPIAAVAPASIDDVPRFEPSEPDDDALGETDNWKAEAEAEAAEGGWSLGLGDEGGDQREDDADDGTDGWKILPA